MDIKEDLEKLTAKDLLDTVAGLFSAFPFTMSISTLAMLATIVVLWPAGPVEALLLGPIIGFIVFLFRFLLPLSLTGPE